MDPIHPITPGPPAISRGSAPIERLQRITRERDRRHKDELAQDQRRAPTGERPAEEEHPDRPPQDDTGTHIDVRA